MALDQDEFYRNLSDELKQKVRDNITACKLSPKFLDDDHKVWHGDIKHCPTCNDMRITSCCACGCGSCYTCNHRFSCRPVEFPTGLTIDITDKVWSNVLAAPEINSRWTHTNGNIYTVINIANKDTEHPDKYPVTVVYTGENKKVWSRPVSDWYRSMKEIKESKRIHAEGKCDAGFCMGVFIDKPAYAYDTRHCAICDNMIGLI